MVSVIEKSSLSRILRLQLVLGLFVFLLLAAMGQMNYAQSCLYGVLLMAVNGWWLARRLARVSGLDVEAGQRSLYAGAAIRFVALIAGLLLAYAIGLHLLLVAAGMFIAQVSVFVSALAGFRKEYASAGNIAEADVTEEIGNKHNSLKK